METLEEKLKRSSEKAKERSRRYREKLKNQKLHPSTSPNLSTAENFTMQWFTYYKEKLSCEVCGESVSAVLEFHHLDPKTKDDNVSTMVTHGATIAEVLFEISKCKVLCRNCHAKVHARLITL